MGATLRHPLADSSLWCWGNNLYGQLGDGTNTTRPAPVRIATAAAAWKAVQAGEHHTCGIRVDGTVWCWGNNFGGQLGDGTTADRSPPSWSEPSRLANRRQRLLGLMRDQDRQHTVVLGQQVERCTSARPGSRTGHRLDHDQHRHHHACGLRSGNSLWCWGLNTFGAIGDGTLNARPQPVVIESAAQWKVVAQVATRPAAFEPMARCGVGINGFGGLGDGTTTDRQAPVQVGTHATWRTVVVADYHTCGIMNDNTLWCWGYNSHGQLGDGTTTNRSTPGQVGTLARWHDVSVGFGNTHALLRPSVRR